MGPKLSDSPTPARCGFRIHRLVFQLGLLALAPALAWSPHTYTTTFPSSENPISEQGRWVNGQTVGLDWANVRTTSGLAFGTESGRIKYDDSTAVLAGVWGPDQTAQATVHSIHQTSDVYEEVELRLRTSISAHRITGYEINFRCTGDSARYVEIVRWNGPLGNFTYVVRTKGPGLKNGDVVKATIVGSTITAYINNVQVARGTDATYSRGSPGIGFYLEGAGTSSDFGFTRFTATDGSIGPLVRAPTTRSGQSTAKGTGAVRTLKAASGGFTGQRLNSSAFAEGQL